MFLKFALTALVLAVVWMLFFRARGVSSARDAQATRRLPDAQELEPCPACGTYRLYGEPCRCKNE